MQTEFEFYKSRQKGFIQQGEYVRRLSDNRYFEYEDNYYDSETPVYCFRGNGLYFAVHTNCIYKCFETIDGGIKTFKKVIK